MTDEINGLEPGGQDYSGYEESRDKPDTSFDSNTAGDSSIHGESQGGEVDWRSPWTQTDYNKTGNADGESQGQGLSPAEIAPEAASSIWGDAPAESPQETGENVMQENIQEDVPQNPVTAGKPSNQIRWGDIPPSREEINKQGETVPGSFDATVNNGYGKTAENPFRPQDAENIVPTLQSFNAEAQYPQGTQNNQEGSQYPQQEFGTQNYWQQMQGFYGYPPPKTHKSPALKAFLWLISVLSVGTILGFGIYVVYQYTPYNRELTEEVPPWYEQYDEYEETLPENEPDYDDYVEVPDPDKERPQIDMAENPDSLTVTIQPEGDIFKTSEIYKLVAPSTVTVSSSMASVYEEDITTTGTGIIATADGYIITNSHVVFNSKNTAVQVTTSDGSVYDAVVVGADRTTDLAVLKTNDHGFTPAEFGDIDEMVIGDEVIAIGNPGGEQFSSSLTKGVISGLDRIVGKYSDNGMTYIQTDAAINPGNSGGPLVNMYGQVIGINSSKIVSAGYEGMGFAIPVSKAQGIINELSSGGYVKGRTRLGIRGRDVNASEQYRGAPAGFIIQEINEDSGFYGTEARVYDIITAIEGEEVFGIESIANLLLLYSPGDEVEITLYRAFDNVSDGEEFDVIAKLLEDTGETQN